MAFAKGNTFAFKKGRSGNPGGRPSLPVDLRELVKVKTASAVAVLVDVMESKKSPPSARVAAATALLDRGWGRPTQSVEADVKGELSPQFLELFGGWNVNAKPGANAPAVPIPGSE